MNRNEYTQIPWNKVETGDVFMHPDGWSIPVTAVSAPGWASTMYGTALHSNGDVFARQWYTDRGYQPYRKVQQLPKIHGYYISMRDSNERLRCLYSLSPSGEWESDKNGGLWRAVPDYEVPTDLVLIRTMPTRQEMSNALPWEFSGEHLNEVMDALAMLYGQQEEAGA